ncbi:hypothetical protein C0J52_17529 [Blattella germanica]|nr:hypothetical protein C0J52_17529 [Blattella germanica]
MEDQAKPFKPDTFTNPRTVTDKDCPIGLFSRASLTQSQSFPHDAQWAPILYLSEIRDKTSSTCNRKAMPTNWYNMAAVVNRYCEK